MDQKLTLPGRPRLSAAGLAWPAILFIVSAGASAWLSYNRTPALRSFLYILLAAGLFFAIANSPVRLQRRAAWALLVLAAAFSLSWTLTHDFAADPGEFGWINSLGSWLNAALPVKAGPTLHPNVAAGTLLVSLPFGALFAWGAAAQRKAGPFALAAGASAVILLGLLLTDSRGAWAGLGAAGLLAGLAAVQRRWFASRAAKGRFWAALLTLALLLAALLARLGYLDRLTGEIPDPGGSMQPRSALWREGLGLARDYFFTGAGLDTFSLNHAAYSILTHVPFTAHSHNAFIEVWVEQGLVGAAALLWGTIVAAGWAWKALDRQDVPGLAWAGLAALCAAGVHGMVEVVFYGEPTLPVIGAALGFASLAAPAPAPRLAEPRRVQAWAPFLAGAALLAGGLLVFYRPLAAAWYANLGALEQSRIELGQFDPANFDHPSLEQIRRQSDLGQAQALFEGALGFQPGNLTALQRLSLIALARAEYAPALAWMETAWNASHRDLTTRLIYGDALVAAGQPDRAADILQGASWAGGRLAGQGWARYWERGDAPRAVFAWEAALMLDPGNTDAAAWLAAAKAHVKP